MRIKDFIGLFPGWNVRWQRFRLAGIILFVLLTLSCSSKKQLIQSAKEVTDSVMIKEIREVIPISVPASRVEMEILTENLHKLPEGATFNDRSGQASVKVGYNPETNTVQISASCDSLQLLVERLERELVRIRSDTAEEIRETTIKSGLNPARTFFSGFLVGIVFSVITIILIIIKRK